MSAQKQPRLELSGVVGPSQRWLTPESRGSSRTTIEPSFSVLIAAYQAADTIAEAVDSALAQTLQPREIIVCDDASDDDIEGVLAPYGNRVKLIRLERNQGPGAARNAALRFASAEFVAILDADDVYLPRWLESIAELASARPDLAILVTDAYLELNGERVRRSYDDSWPFEVADQRTGILERNFLVNLAAVRRSTLLDVGGWDESLRRAQDWDLWLRIIFRGFGAGLVCEPLACYRVRFGSLSTDQVALRRFELMVLEKAARVDLRLTADERQTLEQSLAWRRRTSRLEDLRAALAQGAPDARRLAGSVARESGYALPTRFKAAAAVAMPGFLGRLQRRRERAAWVGAAHIRVERD